MVWCPTCGEDVEVDYSDAMTACVNCGRVLEDAAFASDVTFMKGADGDGELVGQMVGSDGNVRGLQRMAGGKVWSSRVSGGEEGQGC
jgi:transcription factor IIIB subunit 2